MLIKLITADGSVVLDASAFDHRPPIGALIEVDGKFLAVTDSPPILRRESDPTTHDGRPNWVTHVIVEPAAVDVKLPDRPAAPVARGPARNLSIEMPVETVEAPHPTITRHRQDAARVLAQKQ